MGSIEYFTTTTMHFANPKGISYIFTYYQIYNYLESFSENLSNKRGCILLHKPKLTIQVD